MRRKLLIAAAVAIFGGAIAGFVLAWGSDAEEPAANFTLPPATAEVTRTTLVETKTVSGKLGYGEPVQIRGERGILTWAAPVGSTVERGEPLFKVDERPVVVFYGSLPLYRTLRVGTGGRDVRQLEQNLAELGYTGFTVDDTYSAATADVVRTWQAKLGLPSTGSVKLGEVVFLPGAVRVAEQITPVGDAIVGGVGEANHPVLSYTPAIRQVTVELEVADRALAPKGRTVMVRVPGLPPLNGRISQVGTVVTTQGAPDPGSAPDGSSSAPSDARIEVTVTVANQKALGSLDVAPVDVDFVSTKREDVLAVPVVALLALPQGGFGVEVVAGATTRIVPVKTGMFAAGRVEVTGKGIAEGVNVGVPK